ncbi:MAG: hypothetical protein ACJ8LG_23105 [Massilia sp.]
MTVMRTDGVAFPTAKKSASGASSTKDDSEKRVAWLREMEKQQMASWLNHRPLPASASAELAPAAQSGQRLPAAWQPVQARSEDDNRERTHEKTGESAESTRPGSSTPGAPAAHHNGTAEAVGQQEAAAPYGWLPANVPESPAGTAAEPDAAVDHFVGQVMSQLKIDRAGAGSVTRSPDREASIVFGEQAPTVKSDPPAQALSMRGAYNEPVAGKPASAGDADETAETGEQIAAGREQDKLSGKSSEPTPPVRIHAFWSDNSVRIWIGADHSVAMNEQQLAFALQDLRRQIRQQGATLASLTVNGETLFSQDDGAEEDNELHGAVGSWPAYRPAHYALPGNDKRQERE